jgi:hypothetical protein
LENYNIQEVLYYVMSPEMMEKPMVSVDVKERPVLIILL